MEPNLGVSVFQMELSHFKADPLNKAFKISIHYSLHLYHIIYTTQNVKKTFKCPVPTRLCNKMISILINLINFLSTTLKAGS